MRAWYLAAVLALVTTVSPVAGADELTLMAQQDLAELGYDVGAVDGEASTETIIAISQFQAENDMEVTGEVSPQLVGALRAAVNERAVGGIAEGRCERALRMQAADAELDARQRACLEEKVAKGREEPRDAARPHEHCERGQSHVLFRSVAGVVLRTTSTAPGHEAYRANATARRLIARSEGSRHFRGGDGGMPQPGIVDR